MATFNFGNPNMFVMGTVDQMLYDPNSGNVLGYDKLPNDVAVNYTFDLTDITGRSESLVMSIPHTTRLTGTYTSSAFSLEQRALLSGGELNYNAVTRVCETITADSETLAVTQKPAKFYSQPTSDTYGWCYVHEAGATTYAGTNYGVDLTTGEVQNFTAVSGTTYEVTYFTQVASAESVGLLANANPSVVTIHQKWAVYAAQNGNRSTGTLQGYLHFIVPLAMLEGDAGIDGNQTTNSTTSYNWRAFDSANNLPQCDDCDNETNNLAYYVYVPCGNATQSVSALAVVGGTISVVQGSTAQIPVKYIMPNDTLVQPVYSDLTYVSAATGTATVDTNGVVSGVEAGDTTIDITLTRDGQSTLTATCGVTVTA